MMYSLIRHNHSPYARRASHVQFQTPAYFTSHTPPPCPTPTDTNSKPKSIAASASSVLQLKGRVLLLGGRDQGRDYTLHSFFPQRSTTPPHYLLPPSSSFYFNTTFFILLFLVAPSSTHLCRLIHKKPNQHPTTFPLDRTFQPTTHPPCRLDRDDRSS